MHDARYRLKRQIRNPKHEIRNKQIQNPNSPMFQTEPRRARRKTKKNHEGHEEMHEAHEVSSENKFV